jgi:hypothetical protein
MKLNRNEIALISVGGFCILALLVYLFVLSPAMAKEEALIRTIGRKQKDLTEIMKLKSQWNTLRQTQAEAEETLKKRGGRFTLLSFLEGVSRQAGISGNIQYMKPISFPQESGPLKQVGMEIKLEDVDIKQLVDYLYKIEYSENLLTIRRIKIQRTPSKKGPSLLKVVLQVNTYLSAT